MKVASRRRGETRPGWKSRQLLRRAAFGNPLLGRCREGSASAAYPNLTLENVLPRYYHGASYLHCGNVDHCYQETGREWITAGVKERAAGR